jgi:exosortase
VPELPATAATNDPVYRHRTWQMVVAVVVVGILFAYSGFGGMGGIIGIGKQWLKPDYSHGFLVVPFAVYLLWRNRDRFPAKVRWPDYRGLPLVVVPLGIYFLEAKYNWVKEWVQGACLITSLAGVTVMFCGRWAGLRWVLSALLMLLVALPLPHEVEWSVSWHLRRAATVAALVVFRLFGFATHLPDPVTIQVDQVSIKVAEACSGLSMLLAFVALTAAIVLLCPPSRPWIDRWVIFLSAIPIAILCNMIRIVASGLVLVAGWKQAFDFIVHDFAGWAMMPIALGLIWLEFRLIDWILIPVTYMSREEVAKAGFAEARAEIERQEAERKALHATLAARQRVGESGSSHPAAPFLSITPEGTAHGATAAGGTIARTSSDTPHPNFPPKPPEAER